MTVFIFIVLGILLAILDDGTISEIVIFLVEDIDDEIK